MMKFKDGSEAKAGVKVNLEFQGKPATGTVHSLNPEGKGANCMVSVDTDPGPTQTFALTDNLTPAE